MMASRPPRLADWLLLRLASGPRRDSLIGDLHEQYRRGRSGAWYWRQTVKTILAGSAHDLRRHPAESVHALCAALGAWVLYSLVVVAPAWWLFTRVAMDYQWVRKSASIPLVWVPIELIGGWIVGCTVRRFHGERLAAALVLLAVAGIGSGLPRLFSLSLDAWGYPNYRPQLWLQIASLAAPTIGVVIGALSVPRPSEQKFLINNRPAAD